jgi:outer membrane protein assembly factor BamB
VDGDRVYTLSKRGMVFCLDAGSGAVVWSKDLHKDFGIKWPDWGLSGSALVLEDMVVFNAGTSGIAFNKATGALIWQSGKKPSGYATPMAFTQAGMKRLAIFASKSLVAVDAKTGEEAWSYTWKTSWNVNAATPIVSGETMFISSGYGKGCALLGIGGEWVREIYVNKSMRNQCNNSVLWRGYVYGFDGQVGGKCSLTCVDYSSGEVKWSKKGLGTGSVMISDGKLVILGERGRLVIAEASPGGFKELARSQILEGKCWTVPVLSNGRIYARNAEGDLVCLDVRGKGGNSSAVSSGESSGYDWPQFRGPNRDGISPETGLLKKWPEGGAKLLWSVEGLGTGFASVSVVDGCVYTTGMVGKENDGVVFAYELDGNPKWKQRYGKAWTGSHKGTRTTPTLDGDRLYVYSGYGILACYDAKSGEPRWTVDTLARFNGKNIKWGISESVLIYEDKAICTPGGPDATLVALDKMNGETVWTTKGLSEASAYCSPTIIERNGKKLIMTMVEKSIILVEADTGKLVLHIPHEGEHFISAVTPIYKAPYIYATTGYGVGGKMYELSADTTSFVEKWSDKNLDCHHGGVILLDGNIHGSNDDGYEGNKNSWICLDLVSGQVRYLAEMVGKGSAIYADGMLYCYGEKGGLGLVKVADSGYEMVSSFKITKGGGPHWAHPVICNGRLYIRHGDALMVFDIRGK